MSKIEKIKRIVLIALGFAISTYLILSGAAILQQEEEVQEMNATVETK